MKCRLADLRLSSISKLLLNLQASNSSARRPIGQGFALFCLAKRPNEIAVATR